MKYLLFIFLKTLIFLSSCSQKMLSPKKCDFDFDLCHATYKGKPIPFDKPLSEWVQFFGNYDRSIEGISYVWDSIGITLMKSNFSKNGRYNSKENPDELYIFFTNCNSQLGKDRKLEFTFFSNHGQIIRLNEKGDYYVYTGSEIPAGTYDSLEYEYPIKTYKDTVRVNGAIVANGMSLKEVNEYRTKVKGNDTFGYWKGGKENSRRGSTDVKTGQFIDFDIAGKKSPCGIAEEYYYQSSLRYTEGVLEYVKVEKIAKGKSMYWRE
jgi:hypothetical protein